MISEADVLGAAAASQAEAAVGQACQEARALQEEEEREAEALRAAAAKLGAEGERDALRVLASGARHAAALTAAVRREAAAVRREAEQLQVAAGRQADLVRTTAALEAANERAKAARQAGRLLADADADRRRSAAAREADEVRKVAVCLVDEARRLTLDDAESMRRTAEARALGIRAGAEERAALVVAAATEERDAAWEARTRAEGKATEILAEAAAAADELAGRPEAAPGDGRIDGDWAAGEGSDVLAAAVLSASGALDAARRQLDASTDLLAEARGGERGGEPDDKRDELPSVSPAAPDVLPEEQPTAGSAEPRLLLAEPPSPGPGAHPPQTGPGLLLAEPPSAGPGAHPPQTEPGLLVAEPPLAGPVALRPEAELELVPADQPSAATALAPTATPPLLVPALSLGRELRLRLLVLLGLVAGAYFWVWWLGPGHGAWTPGSVMVTVLLAWVFALPAYFYFFACRMTRPNRIVALPDVRVAMVVTKAPSEPWPLVRRTLEAMLGQDLPQPYDVWLADERPSPKTMRWCADNGVQVSTREGVEEYQRETWPRRRRTKEGNLAFFYDHFGYDRYDVVAQLDADHVPAPSYLAEMVRPFADERVGYVSAPSVCDANADQGWTVRGRLYREAAMHGPVQAGSNDGYGPVCIGSHYAVRTEALREVGGLGPELAEDYSTTLWMQSAGWEGVFNVNAEAHGDGPESLDEMLLQELQWARSLGTILVRWAPGKLRSVPWRPRLRLGFALAFYPVQGLALTVATILPLVGVVLQESWGDTSIVGFYVHMWASTLVGLLTAAYLRRCRLLRPVRAKLWSWELVLFQMVRWPCTFWGFLQGMYAGRRSKAVEFKVTPKAGPGSSRCGRSHWCRRWRSAPSRPWWWCWSAIPALRWGCRCWPASRPAATWPAPWWWSASTWRPTVVAAAPADVGDQASG